MMEKKKKTARKRRWKSYWLQKMQSVQSGNSGSEGESLVFQVEIIEINILSGENAVNACQSLDRPS